MVESKKLLSFCMIAFPEMYPVFESPFPTLLTHTENGLGIFVAHPKTDMDIKNIGPDDDIFRVVAGEIDFFFPLKEHARALLESQGGLIAFTDELGMPWYTLEMQPLQEPALTREALPLAQSMPARRQFGRATVRSVHTLPPTTRSGEEGEFSL